MGKWDSSSDALNVIRAQDGESAAIEALYRVWNERFVAHLSRMLRDTEAARDAAQDGWIAIARAINRLDDPALFRSWAYRIMTNKALDIARRHSRDARLKESAANELRVNSEAVPLMGGESEAGGKLIHLIDALSPKRQALLRLYYVEELNIAELAEIFEIPTGTVKSRLFQAREALKKEFAKFEENERKNNDGI